MTIEIYIHQGGRLFPSTILAIDRVCYQWNAFSVALWETPSTLTTDIYVHFTMFQHMCLTTITYPKQAYSPFARKLIPFL